MKRYLALVLTVVFMFAICSQTFAVQPVQPVQPTVESQTINEFEVVKELKQKSDDQLKNQGFSKDEIKEIRALDYGAKIKERAKLDDNKLKNLGYTDQQITSLRNFKGTDGEITALAATLSFSASKNMWSYSSSLNTTFFRVNFSWSWSSSPIFLATDQIAAAWSEGMYQDTGTYTYHTVTYSKVSSGATSSYTIPVSVGAPANGAYSKFAMKRNVTQWDYDWAKSGNGRISTFKTGKVAQCAMKIAYGHTTVSLNPGVTFGGGTSITFTPTYATNEEKSAYVAVP